MLCNDDELTGGRCKEGGGGDGVVSGGGAGGGAGGGDDAGRNDGCQGSETKL